MTILRALLLTSILGVGIGCGGRVIVPSEGDDGGTTDTGGSDGGACGKGTCTVPGYTCNDGCNDCSCGSDGNWSCTLRWCPPDTGTCPASIPTGGTPCEGSMTCSYPGRCGGISAMCAGGTWSVAVPDCPDGCPSTEPAAGSGCITEIMRVECSWTNACGGTDKGWCKSGTWEIAKGPCGATCPKSEPVWGSYCAAPSAPGASCFYTSPKTGCPDICRCGGDHRWSCVAEGCPPPPADPCSEGMPCKSGTGCAVSCVRSCSCSPDGTFKCVPLECDGDGK